MDINEMNLEAVEKRLAELSAAVETMSDIDAIENATNEKRELLIRRKELSEMEARKAAAAAIQVGAIPAKSVEKIEMKGDSKMINSNTPEYRSAFYAMISGTATAEQRAILNLDGDGSTTAATTIAVPHTLDEMIWDNVHDEHPILADIVTVKSGVVMDINKLTAISPRVAGKKDAVAVGELDFTFAPKSLAGKDYSATVPLTYAMAAMDPNGLETFLATSIAAELGEALAKDVVTEMLACAGNARKHTKTANVFADIKAARKLAKHAIRATVYAGEDFWDVVGNTDTVGQPVDIEKTLKCTVKNETAVPAGTILIVDPKKFVLNVIADINVESQRMVGAHRVDVGGYARAEGTMRDDNAVAYIA